MKKFVLALVAICIVSFSVFFLSMGTAMLTAQGRETFVATDTQDYSVPAAGIKNISLNKWGSTRIRVIAADGDDVRLEMTTRYTNGAPPTLKVTVEGDSIIVQNEGDTQFNVGIMLYYECELVVYVPKTYAHNMRIHSGSGSISVTGLTLEQFTFEGGSGSLTTEGLTVKSAILSAGSGSLRLHGFAGDLNATTKSGSTLVEFSMLEDNNVEVHAGSGSITVRVPSQAGYTLDAFTSSGTITTYFPISFEPRNRLKTDVGDGRSNLTLSARSGSINISR